MFEKKEALLPVITKKGGRFIAVLPRHRAEVGQFGQLAAACQARWEHLWPRRANHCFPVLLVLLCR